MNLPKLVYEEYYGVFRDIIYSNLAKNLNIEIGYDIDFKPIFFFTEDTRREFPVFCSKQIEINKWVLDKSPQIAEHLNSLYNLRNSILVGFDEEDSLSGLLELEQALLDVFSIQLLILIVNESKIHIKSNSTTTNYRIFAISEGFDFFSDIEKEKLFSNLHNPIIHNTLFELEAKLLFLRSNSSANSSNFKNNPYNSLKYLFLNNFLYL